MADIQKVEGSEKKVQKGDFFGKIAKGLTKFYREIKSEVKKVIWPSPKQLKDNTIIVISSIIIIGSFISAVGWIFHKGVALIVGQ